MSGPAALAAGRRWATPAAVAAALMIVYAATLAPSVTFWDAGEFHAAAHSLGVPHPPGTPLYVLLARAWATLVPGLEFAARVNLLSAACTAAACATLAALLRRWTGSAVAAGAGGALAGLGSTVWLNATEAEVYAPALLLGVLAVAAADRAGRGGESRWIALVAYLLALAAPLHPIALIVAPACVVLAAAAPGGAARVADGAVVAGAAVLAYAAATARPAFAALGALVAAAGAWRGGRRPLALVVPVVAALAASATLAMLVRAAHDPAVNQGDPSTLARLAEVVARRQYATPGLWPRQAPLWLQLGNLFEWADWQWALGLAPGVEPRPGRTSVTAAYALLAAIGARWHCRRDRRSFAALLVLLLSASVGAVLYLNLKAGPSYGWGVLADGTSREVRERDYFFAAAWAVWGLWAGAGAASLGVARLGRRGGAAAALVAVAVPAALGWPAVDRSREPEAALARSFGLALLASLPDSAVLLSRGDNDSYPLWYLQQVEGHRRDVVVVTMPLLGARWYRAELARRHGLYDATSVERWPGAVGAVGLVAAAARARGRPVALSAIGGPAPLDGLPGAWRRAGLAWIPAATAAGVDTAATRRAIAAAAPGLARRARPSPDPTSQVLQEILACPGIRLGEYPRWASAAERARLDVRCGRL